MRVFSHRLKWLLLIWSWVAIVAEPANATENFPPTGRTWSDPLTQWFHPDISRLSEEAADLADRLKGLPTYSPQQPFRTGYHSQYVDTPDVAQWVQVDLGAVVNFDKIVIAPVYVTQNEEEIISGYGFPKRFRIEVADDPECTQSQLLVDLTDSDVPNPGVYPLQIGTPAAQGRYVRITFTHLATEDLHHFVAIGELMVISGARNIAFFRPVEASSSIEADLRWSTRYLVDEFSVLSAPLGHAPSPSDGFKWQGTGKFPRSITIDLQQPYEVEEVRLYPAQPSDTPGAPGWGFPNSFRIELSETADFQSPVPILDFSDFGLRHWTDRPLIVPTGARDHFTWSIPKAQKARWKIDPAVQSIKAQYVRITSTKGDVRFQPPTVAFSEIQVYAGDENVAEKATVIAAAGSDSLAESRWSRAALVDGYTSRFQLMELSTWLERIDQRRNYETRLAKVTRDLATAREQFESQFRLFGGSFLVAIVTTLLVVIVRQRSRLQRETRKLRERIASDLHDDIGSNLGTIALMSRSILNQDDVSEDLHQDLEEISQIATDTSDSMRDILWLIKPQPLTLEEFVSQMRQVAQRMLGHRQLTFTAPTSFAIQTVDIVWRRNLFLSFKELLHNIQRHSEATSIAIDLQIAKGAIKIDICHDGIPFDPEHASEGRGLPNIRNRMSELQGSVDYGEPNSQRIRIYAPLP